nr:tubby-related protein 1-like isoform X2 [Ipomoea batatas]
MPSDVRSPIPQSVPATLSMLSSGESEGDIVEGEESSSGASDPDYRGMSDEVENARAVLAACRSQNSKRPRRGEPSRSRAPRASPRASPPDPASVLRSCHSSVSTTADNPAPGFAAPMGSTFAMPAASPSWPMSIPPSVSLLQGDVLAEDTVVRYRAMGDALEAEAKARLELEAQMGALNLQCDQLKFQREQMALRERRALEGQSATEERALAGQRAAEEASAVAVTRYRESSAFPVNVQTYISEHVEESYGALKATRAGMRYVAMEAAHMSDIGEYDMQHKIYTQLRCRDPTFDPEAWGLPLELMDLEPQTEPAASHDASGTGAALGDDPFPGLALGLGGAVDTPLDQIHLSPGMANFDQAGTSGARDP